MENRETKQWNRQYKALTGPCCWSMVLEYGIYQQTVKEK